MALAVGIARVFRPQFRVAIVEQQVRDASSACKPILERVPVAVPLNDARVVVHAEVPAMLVAARHEEPVALVFRPAHHLGRNPAHRPLAEIPQVPRHRERVLFFAFRVRPRVHPKDCAGLVLVVPVLGDEERRLDKRVVNRGGPACVLLRHRVRIHAALVQMHGFRTLHAAEKRHQVVGHDARRVDVERSAVEEVWCNPKTRAMTTSYQYILHVLTSA